MVLRGNGVHDVDEALVRKIRFVLHIVVEVNICLFVPHS